MEPDQSSLETGGTHVYNKVTYEWKETPMKVANFPSLDNIIAQNWKIYISWRLIL